MEDHLVMVPEALGINASLSEMGRQVLYSDLIIATAGAIYVGLCMEWCPTLAIESRARWGVARGGERDQVSPTIS